jgi:alpha-1,3-fucosyltransferase
MASWMVSNCHSQPSKRNELVKALQKHVDVEIYGRCGKACEHYECLNEMKKSKFYLALENSICTDYITEKMYKVTGHDVIPVVYSGGL